MNVLNKRYKTLHKIGNGKFGIVYKGINVKTNGLIAIKTENKDSPIKLLKNETTILKYLYDHGSRMTPIVYWYGVDSISSYLVMSYYDVSLHDYCVDIKNSFTMDKIDKIMVVCIDILETIHKQYVIHRDIKPHNFMISNEEIFLIDFGFATFYVDEHGEHLPNLGSQHIIGTPKYISYFVHDGWSCSRRDDLISLGYLYIFLYYRELVWTPFCPEKGGDEIHILHSNNQQLKNIKTWENLETTCAKMNEKILSFLNYCYKLNYDNVPNYDALKHIFTRK